MIYFPYFLTEIFLKEKKKITSFLCLKFDFLLLFQWPLFTNNRKKYTSKVHRPQLRLVPVDAHKVYFYRILYATYQPHSNCICPKLLSTSKYWEQPLNQNDKTILVPVRDSSNVF